MISIEGLKNTDGVATYEEAITLAGYGKFHYLVILSAGFALMTSFVATLDITYILPASECELQLDKADRGMLSGGFFIGVVLSSHTLGFLSDTLGRRYILVRSLFMNIIVYIISSMSTGYWYLLITRLIIGVVLCGVMTCALVYVGEFHCNKRRTKSVVFCNILAFTAFTYSAGLGWLFLPHEWSIPLIGNLHLTPWRVYYIVIGAVPSFIVGVMFYFLPESPKYLLACNEKNKALEILTRVYTYNTGKPSDQYPVKVLLKNPDEHVSKLESKSVASVMKLIWNQTYPLFLPPHVLNMLYSCVITFTLFYSLSGVLIWMPDVVNQLFIIKNNSPTTSWTLCQVVQSNWTANLERVQSRPEPGQGEACTSTLNTFVFQLNATIGVALVLGMVLLSFVLPRVNRKAFVSTTCFTITTVICCLLFVPNLYTIMVCLGFIIILFNFELSCTLTLLVDYFPTNYRAMAVCLSIMAARLGSAVGGYIFNLYLLSDCKIMFYISGALMLLAGICCISLRSPMKTISKKDRSANT